MSRSSDFCKAFADLCGPPRDRVAGVGLLGAVGGGGAGLQLCPCLALQDLPSFTQNVHRLVNDLRYYRLCNDSLPPGTVKL